MKKTIFASIVGLLAIAPFTITTNAQCPPDSIRCPQPPMEGPGPDACCNPYEGLELSDEQQTALKAIQTPEQSLMEAKKEQREAKKEQRDSAMAACKEARANYLGQVKEVLTADQYISFLENFYLNQQPNQRPGRPEGFKRGGKGPREAAQ